MSAQLLGLLPLLHCYYVVNWLSDYRKVFVARLLERERRRVACETSLENNFTSSSLKRDSLVLSDQGQGASGWGRGLRYLWNTCCWSIRNGVSSGPVIEPRLGDCHGVVVAVVLVASSLLRFKSIWFWRIWRLFFRLQYRKYEGSFSASACPGRLRSCNCYGLLQVGSWSRRSGRPSTEAGASNLLYFFLSSSGMSRLIFWHVCDCAWASRAAYADPQFLADWSPQRDTRIQCSGQSRRKKVFSLSGTILSQKAILVHLFPLILSPPFSGWPLSKAIL